ncbi:MAG: hypothetical protein QG621_157 [Patescibacteria group bacterium]|jgi:hypothetical protein|nr:hypothetical protein [Patescibacteria group bacterium]
MQKMHKKLMKKNSMYSTWHKTPYISAAHFVMLAGFGSWMALTLQQAIA